MIPSDADRQVVVRESFGVLVFQISARGIQGDGFYCLADKTTHKSKLLLSDDFAQDAIALTSSVYRDLLAQCGSRSSRGRRVSENVQVGKGKILHQTTGVVEFPYGLAG